MDAEEAIRLACAARPTYTRLSSPHWLDFDYLAEIFSTIEPEDTTVRQLIESWTAAQVLRRDGSPLL